MLVNKEAEESIPDEYRFPNLGYLPIVDWVPFAMAQTCVTGEMLELFNPLNGKYQVDCCMTSKTAAAASIKRMLWIGESVRIPVFISELKAADYNSTHDDVFDLDLKLRSVSYSECPTFFGTEREKKIGIRAGERYLSPAMLDKIRGNGYVRSMGTPLKALHKRAHELPKFDQFTLLFAARFNSNKRWDAVLETFETYCRMNDDVRAIAVAPSLPVGGDTKLTHFQKTEIHEALPRQEYLDTLSRIHLSVSMSIEEGFAFGWSEQIATGNPVLFPDRAWARSLMPKKEYEKCFYKDDKHLLALIEYMRQNYDEIRKEIAPAVEWFVNEHDLPHAAQQYRDHMWEHTKHTFEAYKDWIPRLEEALDGMPNEFTMKEFMQLAHKLGCRFGQLIRQHSATSAFRNAWMWLREHADPQMTQEMVFKKRV